MYPVLKGILQIDGEVDLQEPEFGKKGNGRVTGRMQEKGKRRAGKEKEGLRRAMKDLEEYKIMQDKYEEKWIEAEELTERRERQEQERQEGKKQAETTKLMKELKINKCGNKYSWSDDEIIEWHLPAQAEDSEPESSAAEEEYETEAAPQAPNLRKSVRQSSPPQKTKKKTKREKTLPSVNKRS